MKLTEKEFNLITGEETVTERNETAAETKERLKEAEIIAAIKAQAQAKIDARASILDRLGLTADELQVLLG
jgi:hypothetical protein